ncbi:LysR substrate-binding domain-containing protein [Marinobacterium arenosum]|uniref:LysR substrate-binding domain-containing protein n=1 Tax=Marinobacterium arenosum TaxID=2862496 RepID=UPI001C947D25|nr:LysR substrate-binding domain-containing protein [Marinobacterium arenosum]MBY4677745.1 LysR family transcriptional regulator [Marinobacterium arenosum]
MNAKQLSAFRAVMLTGSMSEASQMLYVSQPAVSRLIKDLEEALDFTLFDRRNSRVYPTQQAHAFFREVERHFIGMDSLGQAADKIRLMKSGSLRIACMPVLGFSEMPAMVADFLRDREGVSASFVTHTSVEVVNMVGAQQYDLGIVMLPVDSSEISFGRCFQVDCQCIAWPGHRFERQERVQAGDLDSEPFIAIGAQNTVTRFRIDSVLRDSGARPDARIETPLFITAESFVRQQLGVSIVDPFTASRYVEQGGVAKPFDPSVPLYFGFITPLNHPPTGLIKEFIDSCIDHLAARWPLQPVEPADVGVAGSGLMTRQP